MIKLFQENWASVCLGTHTVSTYHDTILYGSRAGKRWIFEKMLLEKWLVLREKKG
jgi:hypothetical protein